MNKFRAFMACLTLFWAVGCNDSTVAPDRDQTQARVMSAEEAARIEMWVGRMDSFVSQNADGTFSMDYASFRQEYSDLTPEDAAVVVGLRDGISATNESIRSEGKDGVDTTEGATCWRWWWGTKCCYTGNQAETIIYAATVAGCIAAIYTGGLGAAVGGIAAATLIYFKNVSGGFCFYRYNFVNAIAVTPLR